MHTPSQGPELDLCFALDIMHCFLYLRLRKYIAMVLWAVVVCLLQLAEKNIADCS